MVAMTFIVTWIWLFFYPWVKSLLQGGNNSWVLCLQEVQHHEGQCIVCQVSSGSESLGFCPGPHNKHQLRDPGIKGHVAVKKIRVCNTKPEKKWKVVKCSKWYLICSNGLRVHDFFLERPGNDYWLGSLYTRVERGTVRVTGDCLAKNLLHI